MVSSMPCVCKVRRFEPHSRRNVWTFGKSFTRSCLFYVKRCPAVIFDSRNNLLSSVYTLLANILRCVRLYIKRKYNIIIIIIINDFLCYEANDMDPLIKFTIRTQN